MIQRTGYAAGTFCWADLGVPDQAAGKAFYSELFGWHAVDMPMGPNSVYTMFQIDGKDVCALHTASSDERRSPPAWQLYLAVTDIDTAVKQVEALWGKVLQGPFDVLDSGRMAVVQDPSGAVVSLWQPKKHEGAGVMYAASSLCWFELTSTNTDAAREFYATVFGHASMIREPAPNPYVVFLDGERHIAGLQSAPEDARGAPSQWALYFAVADCDSIAKRAERLGGALQFPPSDIPGVGRLATIRDPQGATFSIVQLAPRDAA